MQFQIPFWRTRTSQQMWLKHFIVMVLTFNIYYLSPAISILHVLLFVSVCRDLSYNKGLTGSLPPAIGNMKKLSNL